MPNIANLLKSEIARVARKEIRGETSSHKKAIAAYRSEIAALKRRLLDIEKQLKRVGRSPVNGASAASTAAQGDDGEPRGRKVRFSATGLAAQRKRLGLSAEACGALIGATGQSVYKWEAGKARPRAKHLPAIAALRKMGKKEAAAQLAALPTE